MDPFFSQAEAGKLSFDDPEPLRAARDSQGRTLLHVCTQWQTLSGLLELGLDANARDSQGLTPLMRFKLGSDCNRLLLQAGGDAAAEDALGNSVLAHQAGVLFGYCGYCRPDFAALELLLEAGARGPGPGQAKHWIEGAHEQVCSGGEAMDARAFERWVTERFMETKGSDADIGWSGAIVPLEREPGCDSSG